MRCVSGTSYLLDKHLRVIVGAKLNGDAFETRVGIETYESIIQINVTEWYELCSQEYQIVKSLQQSECHLNVQHLTNHLLCLTDDGLAISSSNRLMTIRMSLVNFHHLMNLKFCINWQVEELEREVEFKTWSMQQLIKNCVKNIKEKEQAVDEIYFSLMADGLTTRRRELGNEEVKQELTCLCLTGNSKLGTELYGVYLDELIKRVREQLCR